MDMDLNEVQQKLNELEKERQTLLDNINNLLQEVDNIRLQENNDIFLDIEAREKVMKEVNKKLRLAKKEQKKYDLIFDTQIEYAKERDTLINRNFEIISDIKKVNEEVSNLDERVVNLDEIINQLTVTGMGQEAIVALNKEREEILKSRETKLAEIKELEYQKAIIFDSSLRRKEETVVEETVADNSNNHEEIQEPVVEEHNTNEETFNHILDDIEDKSNVVDPNETVNETGEYKIENNDEPEVNNEEENKKHGVLDTIKAGTEEAKDRVSAGIDAIKNGKVDLNPEEKKRPKFIKNITDWCKNHPAAMTIAAGSIAVALLAGGPIAALATTVGNSALGYVAYKSTMGKGR